MPTCGAGNSRRENAAVRGHRDLKPANLFLPELRPDQVTVLDFGIAQQATRLAVVTRTGVVIGTPQYMAPEQARGVRDLGPAADIFSLGCVLYECLLGVPPFVGEHIAAVLVRILMEAPTWANERGITVPEPLRRLIERMLAKEPTERPASASLLLAELDALQLSEQDCAPRHLPSAATVNRASFADDEQALLCVIVAAVPSADAVLGSGLRPVALDSDEHKRREELRRGLGELGASVEWLFDGSLVATLAQGGSAVDQAVRAARAALLLKESWPDAQVALSTGRAAVHATLPVGEAAERAARLLRAHAQLEGDGPTNPACRSGVWLDELSAGLLARQFALITVRGTALLSGEELSADESRPLLGRPTPCVGREQELSILEALLTGCIAESEAQAVLIIAPPGIGKSRLRHELLRRLSTRRDELTILVGYGEQMTSGSPYSMLRRALKKLCGVLGGEPLAVQRARLEERLGARLPAVRRRHVVDFLGELCGLSFSSLDSVILRAARSDPKIMSDQIAEAFIDFLRAECAAAPVLLVLEDLHWGDEMTVKLLTLALHELDDQPFMIAALARPELHTQFPRLWAGCRLRELTLMGLSKKASERLVQQVLGKQMPPTEVARIVEQAAGNALFLEELIRAHAEGKGDALPETVLAILQARIGRLEVLERRVLRAASVFGLTFWRGGIAGLTQQERSRPTIDAALNHLVESELIELHAESRFPGEPEYSFRHALIREAAYGLLTADDRTLGHCLAGEYLEQMGELDALVLAEHFERGQQPERAADHYLRAASQSVDQNDLGGALLRIERAISCGAQGETLASLRALSAMAHCWRSDVSAGYAMATAALPFIRRASRFECIVLFHGTWAALVLGQESDFAAMAMQLINLTPEPEARRDYLLYCPLAASLLTSYGRRELARALLARSETLLASEAAVDLDLRGAQAIGQSDYVRAFEPSPLRQLDLTREAASAFAQIGDRRNLVTAQSRLGQAQAELGDPQAGEQTLREAVALAQRIRVPFALLQAELHLAALLCKSTSAIQREEASAIATAILRNQGLSLGYQGWARGILAQTLLSEGDAQRAAAEAEAALQLCRHVPLRQLWVRTLLIRSLLQLGRCDAAQELVREIEPAIARLGGAGYVEVDALLAAAEAADAAGASAAARAALGEALRQLTLRTSSITDPIWRERYMSGVPENARVCLLAQKWLPADPSAAAG